MIIKKADDKNSEIAALEALKNSPHANAHTCKLIEQEIRKTRAGIKGEAEAAYEIDFHLAGSKNYAVIHDLRIECGNRVAQIDHLVIGRFLDFWVCETKNFSGGIAVNEQGECTTFYNNRPQGIASPIEQNRKHILVLESLCRDGDVQLPKRLGLTLKPNMRSVILISKNARISRPATKLAGLDNLIKSDQFWTLVTRDMDKDTPPLSVAKLIGRDTLENLASSIAAQHTPKPFNWAAKFDLPSDEPIQSSIVCRETHAPYTAATPSPLPQATHDSSPAKQGNTKVKRKLICAMCAEAIAFNVARFCWRNKKRFGENTYCMDCQKTL